MHKGWEEAMPVSLKGLYSALLYGQVDVTVKLAFRHGSQLISLGKLLRLSGEQLSDMMVEPTACLAFASKYSWDEQSPQGKIFARMCGESACLGALLTEVSTATLLRNMSQHMYKSKDPSIRKPQKDLQKMKVCLTQHAPPPPPLPPRGGRDLSGQRLCMHWRSECICQHKVPQLLEAPTKQRTTVCLALARHISLLDPLSHT